jgi:hypothetical protein
MMTRNGHTPTLLEELTKDFPDKMRLAVREALDRTRIQNPNDPIYELMIVLGIWAKYYERIPASVKEAGDGLERKNAVMLTSLDTRMALLQKLAQAIQAAVDQLDGAPKAIVDRFPTESLAASIAAKLDALALQDAVSSRKRPSPPRRSCAGCEPSQVSTPISRTWRTNASALSRALSPGRPSSPSFG